MAQAYKSELLTDLTKIKTDIGTKQFTSVFFFSPAYGIQS